MSRKCKVLYLSSKTIIESLFTPKIKIALNEHLPENYQVEYTFHSPEHDAFGFVISSNEFDNIPIGERFPAMYVPVHLVKELENASKSV